MPVLVVVEGGSEGAREGSWEFRWRSIVHRNSLARTGRGGGGSEGTYGRRGHAWEAHEGACTRSLPIASRLLRVPLSLGMIRELTRDIEDGSASSLAFMYDDLSPYQRTRLIFGPFSLISPFVTSS